MSVDEDLMDSITYNLTELDHGYHVILPFQISTVIKLLNLNIMVVLIVLVLY